MAQKWGIQATEPRILTSGHNGNRLRGWQLLHSGTEGLPGSWQDRKSLSEQLTEHLICKLQLPKNETHNKTHPIPVPMSHPLPAINKAAGQLRRQLLLVGILCFCQGLLLKPQRKKNLTMYSTYLPKFLQDQRKSQIISLSSGGQLHCIAGASVPSQSVAFSLAWYSVKAAFCSSVLALLAGILPRLRVETNIKVVDLGGNSTMSWKAPI